LRIYWKKKLSLIGYSEIKALTLMKDLSHHSKQRALKKLERIQILSGLSLLWENLTVAFWKVDIWIIFFAALWLLQIPSLFGNIGNALALIIFMVGLTYGLIRSSKRIRWPSKNIINRRIQNDNNTSHRPLDQITDTLANSDKETTKALWQKQSIKAFAQIRNLRAVRPHPVLSKYDPMALRIFVLLFLAIGIFVSGSQWNDRIAFGLTPFSVYWQDKTQDNIVLWITPPEYTKQDQITIQGLVSYAA